MEQKLTQEVADKLQLARTEIEKVIVGQNNIIESLFIAILCDGHVLLEGAPGLAKSLLCSTLSEVIDSAFSRIQFTPDLLPGDIVGTPVYNQQTGEFYTQKGPVFANIVLADEVNRAPAKVQSALLEAMQERQVTIGDRSWPLPGLFMVLATQNPIEQEGTYRLPEAQLDRFIFKLVIDYPNHQEEVDIVRRMATNTKLPAASARLAPEEIIRFRALVDEITVEPKLFDYAVEIAEATRSPEEFAMADIRYLIRYGASPRASIALIKAARARALMDGRSYVIPDDIKLSGTEILRHRLVLSYEARAEEISEDEIIDKILNQVEVRG